MEKWINNIENTPAGNYYEESDNEPANIIFCLDTRDIIDSDSFNDIKANIKTITDDAFGKYDDIKVYVYYQRFGSNFKVTNNLLIDSKTGENYFTCYEDAEAALDRLERYLIKSNFWAYDEEEINRIYVSLICPNSEKVIDSDSYIAQLVKTSGELVYTAAYKTEPVEIALFSANSVSEKKEDSETEVIAENLKSILGIGSGNQYQILTHTGDVGFITLDKSLTAGSNTDTDGDGLSDWEEVDTGFIAKYMEYEYGYSEFPVPDNGYKISNEDLPTISYVLQYYDWKSYMKNVPTKLMMFATHSQTFFAIRLLPIVSDPTSIDSDGDYMLDGLGDEIDKTDYWDIKDPNPLYAYADTKDNYGKNAAGIYVSKTKKSPEEYLVKKSVTLPYFIYQTETSFDRGFKVNKLDGPSKVYVAFPYELQEYMQSCCDTVINAYKISQGTHERVLDLLEKYLTPELIMAIGTTESGWVHGAKSYDKNGNVTAIIGEITPFTGIVSSGSPYIQNMLGASGASTDANDYINIYCSIAGTACIIANDINYVFNNKKYNTDDDQQLLYDALYAYGAGTEADYYRSETRISSAYKLFAFQEFRKVRGNEWVNWDKQIIGNYCGNVTTFTWEYNKPTSSSYFVLPENSRSKPTVTGENP